MTDELREGVDYTVDEQGRLIFTREYHLKRGYCCKNRCRNCPYGLAPASNDPKNQGP
jgi:hypothetical protein